VEGVRAGGKGGGGVEEERRVHPEGCDVGVNTELERCCFCPQSAVQWREKKCAWPVMELVVVV